MLSSAAVVIGALRVNLSFSAAGSVMGGLQCRITSLCTRTSTKKIFTFISCLPLVHIFLLPLYRSIARPICENFIYAQRTLGNVNPFIIYYVMKYRKILNKYNAYISQP